MRSPSLRPGENSEIRTSNGHMGMVIFLIKHLKSLAASPVPRSITFSPSILLEILFPFAKSLLRYTSIIRQKANASIGLISNGSDLTIRLKTIKGGTIITHIAKWSKSIVTRRSPVDIFLSTILMFERKLPKRSGITYPYGVIAGKARSMLCVQSYSALVIT